MTNGPDEREPWSSAEHDMNSDIAFVQWTANLQGPFAAKNSHDAFMASANAITECGNATADHRESLVEVPSHAAQERSGAHP